MISVELSPESIQELARIAQIPALLPAKITSAMTEGADTFIDASRSNMQWQHPTGRLENSMRWVMQAPHEIRLGSDLPYARRRELGFQGADSRGRVYHDRGAFFLQTGIDDNEERVLIMLDEAVMSVLIGGE